PDGIEIEGRLHQPLIVGDGVDDLDVHRGNLRRAQAIEVDIARIGRPVLIDQLRPGEYRFGNLFGRRTAVADVVLDAEIAVRAARVVTRRQNDAAEGPMFTDHIGCGWRREEAAATDENPAKAVRCRHPDHRLDDVPIVEAPVAAYDERLAGESLQRIEDRLNEVLRIARLLENRDLLAKAGGAGPLPLPRLGSGCSDHRLALRFSRGAATAAGRLQRPRNSAAYFPALRSHETSARIPRRCTSRHAV